MLPSALADLLADPVIQSSALPLATAVVLTGGLGALGGRRLAAAAIPVTFILLFVFVIGLPALPPPSSSGRLFWSAAVGAAIAIGLDLLRPAPRVTMAVVAVWFFAALAWLVGSAVASLADGLAVMAAVVAGGWIVWHAGQDPDGDQNNAEPVASGGVLLAWALAPGAAALIGASASMAQLGLSLTAAAGGFLLWNWPQARHDWGASGRIGLGIAVLLAVALAVFSSATQTGPLALTLLAPVTAALAQRFTRTLHPAIAQAATVVAAVIPTLAALAVILLSGSGEAPLY